MLLCCCVQRTVVVSCPEVVMWQPPAVQPPRPSSRSKSQCAATGSTPTDRCRRATVTGCTGLHPSAHETHCVKQSAEVSQINTTRTEPHLWWRISSYLFLIGKYAHTCENATQLLQHHARTASHQKRIYSAVYTWSRRNKHTTCPSYLIWWTQLVWKRSCACHHPQDWTNCPCTERVSHCGRRRAAVYRCSSPQAAGNECRRWPVCSGNGEWMLSSGMWCADASESSSHWLLGNISLSLVCRRGEDDAVHLTSPSAPDTPLMKKYISINLSGRTSPHLLVANESMSTASTWGRNTLFWPFRITFLD